MSDQTITIADVERLVERRARLVEHAATADLKEVAAALLERAPGCDPFRPRFSRSGARGPGAAGLLPGGRAS